MPPVWLDLFLSMCVVCVSQVGPKVGIWFPLLVHIGHGLPEGIEGIMDVWELFLDLRYRERDSEWSSCLNFMQ
jgi:hypothetical protein